MSSLGLFRREFPAKIDSERSISLDLCSEIAFAILNISTVAIRHRPEAGR
jgi:hypothetical protein